MQSIAQPSTCTGPVSTITPSTDAPSQTTTVAPPRIRSLLWVGNTTTEAVDAALRSSQADLIVTDIEDTVPNSRKHAVREELRVLISGRRADAGRRPLFVRPNPIDEPLGAADLAVLAEAGVDGLVVPKATPERLRQAHAAGVSRLVALIETAEGVEHAGECAACPGVELIEFGAMDLGLETRVEPLPNGLEHAYTRSRLVLASRAAGLPGPIDAVYPDVGNLEGYREAALLGRAMGFGGMPSFTDEQTAIANEVFTPGHEEVERARRTVVAYDAALAGGSGVAELDGVLIERPAAERARRVLEDAGAGH